MSVNSYLNDLASKLVLDDYEKDSISKSINTLQDRAWKYFSGLKDVKIFGSYVRRTILPRKIDENSDIDVMLIFDNSESYKPQSFLNRIKNFVDQYYSRSEIYQSSPTIVLELNHIKFEITPAYVDYGCCYIPDGPSNWKYTNPDGFHDELLECNKNNSYKIKPIIRLIKYWNIEKNNRDLESFMLEKKISGEMKYSYFSCTTYSDYAIKALEVIKYDTDYQKINKAIDTIKEALYYEQNDMPYTALGKIKEVFPGC